MAAWRADVDEVGIEHAVMIARDNSTRVGLNREARGWRQSRGELGEWITIGNFEVAVLMGIVFGLGYGAYQAVDWALASDILPSEDDYAKDMGVWHVAMTLPQSIATPIAGVLLDNFQRIGKSAGQPTLGYTVIFGIACVYFLLGTVLVRQVKGAK